MLMPPATLNATEIALRVPHRGAMCLLDRVTSWSEENISASATIQIHQNPLTIAGKLDSTPWQYMEHY
jgi:predicted hotdog family 3-hydroxylacyl-ACP dehydratase